MQPAKAAARHERGSRIKGHMHGIRARAAAGVKAIRRQFAQELSGNDMQNGRENRLFSISRSAKQIGFDGLLAGTDKRRVLIIGASKGVAA